MAVSTKIIAGTPRCVPQEPVLDGVTFIASCGCGWWRYGYPSKRQARRGFDGHVKWVRQGETARLQAMTAEERDAEARARLRSALVMGGALDDSIAERIAAEAEPEAIDPQRDGGPHDDPWQQQ